MAPSSPTEPAEQYASERNAPLSRLPRFPSPTVLDVPQAPGLPVVPRTHNRHRQENPATTRKTITTDAGEHEIERQITEHVPRDICAVASNRPGCRDTFVILRYQVRGNSF
ncbi:hypothetical protein DPEC_G00358910 [Dallia pectoralis]|uniref:Uncharacterized protein n=1 Tax=Dallia pectoralis TaxID=75939 RepID=A0ACC2F0E6_DALPE|nr:hypothetical protein DPEC_G00358910 [Dallia pectoralis]